MAAALVASAEQEEEEDTKNFFVELVDECAAAAAATAAGSGGVPWSWVANEVAKFLTAYPGGASRAVLLTEVCQAWKTVGGRMGRLGLGTLRSRKGVTRGTVLEAVVSGVRRLPGTHAMLLDLVDADSPAGHTAAVYVPAALQTLVERRVIAANVAVRLTQTGPSAATAETRLLPTRFLVPVIDEKRTNSLRLASIHDLFLPLGLSASQSGGKHPSQSSLPSSSLPSSSSALSRGVSFFLSSQSVIGRHIPKEASRAHGVNVRLRLHKIGRPQNGVRLLQFRGGFRVALRGEAVAFGDLLSEGEDVIVCDPWLTGQALEIGPETCMIVVAGGSDDPMDAEEEDDGEEGERADDDDDDDDDEKDGTTDCIDRKHQLRIRDLRPGMFNVTLFCRVALVGGRDRLLPADTGHALPSEVMARRVTVDDETGSELDVWVSADTHAPRGSFVLLQPLLLAHQPLHRGSAHRGPTAYCVMNTKIVSISPLAGLLAMARKPASSQGVVWEQKRDSLFFRVGVRVKLLALEVESSDQDTPFVTDLVHQTCATPLPEGGDADGQRQCLHCERSVSLTSTLLRYAEERITLTVQSGSAQRRSCITSRALETVLDLQPSAVRVCGCCFEGLETCQFHACFDDSRSSEWLLTVVGDAQGPLWRIEQVRRL